jgi:hypothetical protein
MTFNRWILYRQAISIVEQAWFQLEGLLPPSLDSEMKAIRIGFQNLRDALFKAEIAEVKRELNEDL